MRKLGAPDHLIDIIRSFYDNMKAKLRVDGEMLREIEVENGLRQDCTMAPILFNLYACVVAKRWLERVCDVEGVEYGRRFSRLGDLKRYKCLIERTKPIEQQQDAVQCGGCQKWFCSKVGLAVHKCEEDSSAL